MLLTQPPPPARHAQPPARLPARPEPRGGRHPAALLDDLRADARTAFRQFRGSAGSTGIAVLTLGLAIGAATTAFSMVDALVLRPLPFRDLDRLVAVRQFSPAHCPGCDLVAPGNFLSLRDGVRTLSGAAAAEPWAPALRGPEATEVLRGFRVTPDFFRTLGARAALGRTLAPGEEQAVVIGHRLWAQRFAADPAVVGRTVTLGGVPHTVVGVLAPEHTFPPAGEVWAPLPFRATEAAERASTSLHVFARLAPGATLAQARAEAAALGERLAAEHPESMRGWSLQPYPAREWRGHAQLPSLVVLGAVLLVLLVACANLAGLLLARASARRRELAIRAALGAPRGRVARQLLTESVLLGMASGAAGAAFAAWAVPALRRGLPAYIADTLPGWAAMSLNARVLAFALAAAVGTGILFGLAPALRLSCAGPAAALGDGGERGGERGGRRLRQLLLAGEIAFTFILLVSTALVARSVANLYRRDPGVRTENVLTMAVRLPAGLAGERTADTHRRLVAGVEALPGVRSAALVNTLPLGHGFSSGGFQVEGTPQVAASERPGARFLSVTPHYFRTMGVPLRRGRAFDERDREGAPAVAVINETLARRFFADADPVGRALVIDGARHEIVGVAADVLHRGVEREAGNEIYRPQAQAAWPSADLAVRTAGDPAAAAGPVRRALAELDPDVAVTRMRTMESLAAEALAPYRLLAAVYGALAVTALLISAIGLYGLVSYLVERRTRELGVRMALGARPGAVLRMVLGQGARLAAAGLAVGLAGALAATRFMRVLLHGVEPTDPAIFAGVALLLAAVALAASYVPARRATRVDPMTALRSE